MRKITEIIPANLPDWAVEAMNDGQLFTRMVERIESYQEGMTLLRRISERGLRQAQANLNHRDIDIFQHLLDEIKRIDQWTK